MLGRAVLAVEDELRKRLGSRFTISELARLYRESGDVLCDAAMAAVPPGEDLGDVSAACDAAFYLYMREAADFAGGRPVHVAGRVSCSCHEVVQASHGRVGRRPTSASLGASGGKAVRNVAIQADCGQPAGRAGMPGEVNI